MTLSETLAHFRNIRHQQIIPILEEFVSKITVKCIWILIITVQEVFFVCLFIPSYRLMPRLIKKNQP